MNKIALRINKFWKHLYYQGLYFLDHRYPLPFYHLIKQDHFITRLVRGFFYPSSDKVEIHKTRGLIDIYISTPYSTSFSLAHSFYLHRFFFNLLKTRVQLFTLYTFPLHDAELLVNSLINSGFSTSPLNKSRLRLFKRLWKMGIIKGIKIKIKGRYKKGASRSKNEVYQFGQIPNTPTTDLRIQLFYTSRVLIQSLGTSSLHLYICYSPTSSH